MKLIIDIPKEFETDYQVNKFTDFFIRASFVIEKGNGLHGLCGNYEKETAEMFLKAFDESVPMDNIVEKLEENSQYCVPLGGQSFTGIKLETAINIVNQESEQIDKKF